MLITLDGSIITLIVLFILLINSSGLSGNKQNSIFKIMVVFNIILTAVDLLTWFVDGRQGVIAGISIRVLYFLLYSLPVVPSFLFTIYIYDLINVNIFNNRNITAFFTIIILINTLIAFFSLFFGWYFNINAGNAYRRGSYVYLLVIFTVIPFLFSIFVLCKNRKQFKKRYFYSLIFYFVPQTAGIVIQFFNYGYTTNWIGMMLSLLIIYMNIQSLNLNTDYLTGVNNRRYLEETVTAKIRRVSKSRTFVAVLFDIDDFKLINDNFGHDTGDSALKDIAYILKSSIKNDDYVARIGGDEFLVLADIQANQEPMNILNKIFENTDKFNKEKSRPYILSLSAGYHKYVYKSAVNTEELLKTVDRRMYGNKKSKGRI